MQIVLFSLLFVLANSFIPSLNNKYISNLKLNSLRHYSDKSDEELDIYERFEKYSALNETVIQKQYLFKIHDHTAFKKVFDDYTQYSLESNEKKEMETLYKIYEMVKYKLKLY